MDNDPLSQDEIDALLSAMSSEQTSSPPDDVRTPKTFLLQSEIDTLLNAVSSTQMPDAGDATASLPGVSVISSKHRNLSAEKYDFNMPDRASRNHVRSLRSLHRNYAQSLSSALSAVSGTSVEVECIHIDQLTYGEYISSLLYPSCIGTFSMKPLKGPGMIEMNPPLVFSMIDRLLGGSGASRSYNRTFTAIEGKLIEKVMEKALEMLQEAWKRSIKLETKLERLESNPQSIQAAATGDPVILILFDVRLSNVQSMMSLCFPFLGIRQALADLRREEFPGLVDDEEVGSCREMMYTHLLNLDLTLSARYESGRVILRDLLKLQKGDVIKLQNVDKDEALIFIAGQRKFHAKPGTVNGRRAIQICGTERKVKLRKTVMNEAQALE